MRNEKKIGTERDVEQRRGKERYDRSKGKLEKLSRKQEEMTGKEGKREMRKRENKIDELRKK